MKKFLQLFITLTLIWGYIGLINVQGQSFCSPLLHHGGGFYTSIHSVIDNGSDFTITLRVMHDGCNDPNCKPLNQYSVSAITNTYSNVTYENIDGEVTLGGINLGPNIGGWSYTGFRISSINNLGAGQAGVFYITYTLSYLQDQVCMAKAGDYEWEVTFYASDFLGVLDCPVEAYYLPPDGGKIGNDSKIGSELTALALFQGTPVSDNIFQIIGNDVLIEATPVSGNYQELLDSLTLNYGMTNVIPGTDTGSPTIIGQIPISNLLSLNDLSILLTAVPFYPVSTNIGLVTSQGDSSLVAKTSRDLFRVGNGRSINGSGVKVGVLSNSFNTKNKASDDVDKFDLPGHPDHPYNNIAVDVQKEFPYGEASDEGRAMLQLIHDIAPGAELAFRTGVLGATDMVAGIQELVDAGCTVLVDDISYVTEPYFEDGIIAQKVDEITANGISYFTSAGNFGTQSYQNSFNYSSLSLAGISGTPHAFGINPDGSDDVFQEISFKPGKYTFVLQWATSNSSFYATDVDLDIYLTLEEGTGFLGYNKDNTGEKAMEVVPFYVYAPTTANLVVVNETNTDPVDFKYIVFKGDTLLHAVEYVNGNATIVGHANAAGAMTVGAARYDNTPAYNNPIQAMSFSSAGGKFIDGIDRYKPDFIAPNGVNTTVDLGSPDLELDGYPNFFGTSAAAPHAAAVAALMLDARNVYWSDLITPDQVRSILSTTASGYNGTHDYIYGNGFIQADAALMDIANPRPRISGFSYDPPDATPGEDSVTLTVNADYLTDQSVVYFNNNPIDYIPGTKQVIIEPFEELYPPIHVWNPPQGTNNLDGGFSDPVYFNTKPTIVGVIENPTKSYGESLPAEGYSVTYQVHYIGDSIVDLADADLPQSYYLRIVGDPSDPDENGIPIVTNADALSNAGEWPIYASYNDPLNPDYTGGPIDPTSLEAEMLANYNFRFEDGILTITKLDLTITPNDMTLDYGDAITNVTYSFDFDDTYISAANKDTILDSLISAYYADLAEFIALVDSSTIGDGYGDIENTSFFVSQNAYDSLILEYQSQGQALALVNGQALALVNGQALALVNGQALALVNGQALALVNGQALALVNANTFVNGQALALVNAAGTATGQALALVNGQALALVNSPQPEFLDTAYVNGQALALVNRGALENGQALALVNGQALALVNGQALALVNGTSVNEVNNNEAIIVMTAQDVITANTIGSPENIELISMTMVTGKTAGIHDIVPGAFIASNFNVSYGLGTLTINKKEVDVFSNLQVILEGEPEPPFTFTYNGFVNGETEADVFGPYGPDYYTNYISDPGIYPVIFPASTDNYTFTLEPGINLYVNPDGNGTKSVKPKLRCIEETGDPDPNKAYRAFFDYDNNNDDAVFVFMGPNNELEADPGGSWTAATPQPQLFLPGNDLPGWEVLFDGTKITWTVKSQNSGHPSGTGSSASSTSNRCGFKSFELPSAEESMEFIVYPNPTAYKVTIELGNNSIRSQDILIYDILGTQYKAMISHISEYKIQLDLSGMPAGVYFVKVKSRSKQENIKIIKY